MLSIWKIGNLKKKSKTKIMTNCENCDSRLSKRFAKVYGDNDGVVHRCIHCVDPDKGGRSILRHGGGAIRDMDEIERRMTASKGKG
jgi:hypothetical protein